MRYQWGDETRRGMETRKRVGEERAKEIAAALQSPYVSIATKYADIMTHISSEFDFTPARRMTGYGTGLGHKHGCVPPSRPRPLRHPADPS